MTKATKEVSNSDDDFNSQLVRQLAEILDETNLSEIEYDMGGLRIRVARQIKEASYMVAAPTAPMASPASAALVPANGDQSVADPSNHPGAIKAPMVGVAYLAAEPDTPPFIKTGDKVEEGQTLLLIEAMKTFNPVRANKAGTVTSVLVTDGQPVEFDQTLVVIN
ncbi:MAG: acetyl-CoA carboxylase biotin carboxyl carrier protein subunit [Rhodospirillaceae bacterium]